LELPPLKVEGERLWFMIPQEEIFKRLKD